MQPVGYSEPIQQRSRGTAREKENKERNPRCTAAIKMVIYYL